jgi:hypothetical protein
MEQMIAATVTNNSRAQNRSITNQAYKELTALSGELVEIDGLLSVRFQGGVVPNVNLGTYNVTYTVARVNNQQQDFITRTLRFHSELAARRQSDSEKLFSGRMDGNGRRQRPNLHG